MKLDRLLKPAVLAAASFPAALLAADLLRGSLVDPIAQGMNRLGFWTLVLLCATLACTPAKLLLGWIWPNRLRRMLGLLSFAYAAAHFLFYLVLDQALDLAAVWEDISRRKFITVGFASFLLLVPLALTSADRMVRWLGFRRWKALHRLVYAAAAGGVVHFVWRVKSDYTQPILFGAVVAFLLLVRVQAAFARRRAAGQASRASVPRGQR